VLESFLCEVGEEADGFGRRLWRELQGPIARRPSAKRDGYETVCPRGLIFSPGGADNKACAGLLDGLGDGLRCEKVHALRVLHEVGKCVRSVGATGEGSRLVGVRRLLTAMASPLLKDRVCEVAVGCVASPGRLVSWHS
jgi:hypothetical protein